MKNIFRFLMAVAVLFTASCAKEDISSSIAGGEVEVTFTANLPELGTRAYGEGKLAKELTVKVFESNTNEALTALNRTVTSDTGVFTFQLVLLKGMKYDIVLWAQDPTCNYYELNGKVVTMDYTDVDANDETRDAFYYYVQEFDPAVNTPSFSLTRPFAQLNAAVSQSDMTAVNNSKVELTTSTVKVKTYTTLDISTGEVGDETTVEFNATTMPKEAFNGNYTLLSMNYILVPQTANGKMLSNVEFTFNATKNGSETAFTGTSYQDVPLKRNYRTNILGSLLTKPTDFEVKIEADFFEPDQAPEELFLAAVNGGEVTLTEDVVLTQPLNVLSTMTLNLNGHTISTTEESAGRHYYAIFNNGNLTIKGDGAIDARGIKNFGEMVVDGDLTITNVDTNGGAAIWNEGKLTINKGTFATNNTAGPGSYGAALNTRANGEAVVNGGNFYAYSQLTYAIVNEGKTTINNATVVGKHGAVAGAESNDNTVINGGSFELMENPGVSDHCTYCVSAIYGGTFSLGKNTDSGARVFCDSNIADGYKVIEKDGLYYVVAENTDAVVTNKTEIKNALTAAKDAGETNVVIDAAGANIGDLNYGLTQATIPAGTTVTLCNANVEGKSYGNGINGTVIFENCTFNNPNGAYSIHFDSGSGDVKFKNCKLYGWNSFGSSLKSVSFEGCSLNGNGIYALIRSYVDLTLKDCTINTTNANHTDNYNEGVEAVDATLTEENVTYIDNHTAYLQDALKAGKDVVLSSDLTINEGEMITAPYGNKMAFSQNGGVFDGNGKTISCTIGGDNYAVMTAGGTIKNLTIDNGFRGIVIMYATQTIYIDNVVSSGDGVCYALNTAEGDSTQDLVVTNSTFNGWSSWSLLKSASFTNCTFGQGTYYTNVYGRLAKPYVNTLFDGCEFCSKYYIDLSTLGNGQKVTLKNCAVNGVKLTAQNLASLVAPESSCGDGQISIELKDGTYMTAENVADYIVIE